MSYRVVDDVEEQNAKWSHALPGKKSRKAAKQSLSP